MIAFRKANPTLVYGDFEDLLPDHSQLYVYVAGMKRHYLVAHNFSDQPIPWISHQKNTGSHWKSAPQKRGNCPRGKAESIVSLRFFHSN